MHLIRCNRNWLLVVVLSTIGFGAHAFPYVDSSEESSIDFLEMEAVESARIIHFKWDVAAEISGNYFVIEKSIDNQENWTQMTRVESLENHNERHTYEISEINLAQGAREYFRIVRVDQYDNREVLDVIDISHPILSNMKLIPDPKKVQRSVTVSCESLIESDGSVYVYDQEGELVLVQHMPLSEGYNRLVVPIRNFKQGDYRVVVRNEFSDALTRRLVVH